MDTAVDSAFDPDRTHQAVRLTHPMYGLEADIDTLIAPLIEALWKRGIDTDASCQRNLTADPVTRGWIWISFSSAADAEEFLDCVAGRSGNFYDRVAGDAEDTDGFPSAGCWAYSVQRPWNYGMEHNYDEKTHEMTRHRMGPNGFQFSVSVRFPPSDLSKVLARVLKLPEVS